jgi:hypothetical protein
MNIVGATLLYRRACYDVKFAPEQQLIMRTDGKPGGVVDLVR